MYHDSKPCCHKASIQEENGRNTSCNNKSYGHKSSYESKPCRCKASSEVNNGSNNCCDSRPFRGRPSCEDGYKSNNSCGSRSFKCKPSYENSCDSVDSYERRPSCKEACSCESPYRKELEMCQKKLGWYKHELECSKRDFDEAVDVIQAIYNLTDDFLEDVEVDVEENVEECECKCECSECNRRPSNNHKYYWENNY